MAAAKADVHDRLNGRVERKSAAFLAKHKADGTAVPPEVLCAQRPMSLLWCGGPIYTRKSKPLAFAYAGCGAAFIAWGTWQSGLPCALACFVITFLVYDAYSGVMHVTLDHPNNLKMPIIGQPCLEFQWHHHIPDDITSKSFLDDCADLNLPVGLNLFVHFFTTGRMGGAPVVLMLLGFKMLCAWFGQFSHRSAHQSKSQRGPFVTALQEFGIMTTFATHRGHHTPPHDMNFCLIGPCNGFVASLARAIPDPRHWLVLFLLWSVFDVYLLAALMNTVFVDPSFGTSALNATIVAEL